MFSRACEYGIRSLIYITMKSIKGERMNLTEISQSIDSPPAFTAKILQKLVKGNIVTSIKGPNGGFEISKEVIERVRLSHVVEIIDGDSVYKSCGIGLDECNALRPCPLHDRFTVVRSELKKMLEETTLKELSQRLDNGGAFLKL